MINGNITAIIQEKKKSNQFNAIGERVSEYTTILLENGFLDLSGGDSKYNNYNTKIQESTHIFICDYTSISKKVEDKIAIIDNEKYDILLIDDPMNLHEQLEIYLKYVGG